MTQDKESSFIGSVMDGLFITVYVVEKSIIELFTYPFRTVKVRIDRRVTEYMIRKSLNEYGYGEPE